MIKFAIWIIAICEIVRAAQNAMQLMMIKCDAGRRENLYSEFIKSLSQTDREFVRMMLDEYEQQEEDDDRTDN